MGIYSRYRINRLYYIQYHILSMVMEKGEKTMKRCEKCGLILNLIDYTLEFSKDTITQTKEYRCPQGHTTLKEVKSDTMEITQC